MLQKQFLGVPRQAVAGLAGCVELGKEGECLPAHGFLDQGRLAEVSS
ncbi:hypothetical protein ACFRFU_40200 [Streptomyces sp. NPDC056704]